MAETTTSATIIDHRRARGAPGRAASEPCRAGRGGGHGGSRSGGETQRSHRRTVNKVQEPGTKLIVMHVVLILRSDVMLDYSYDLDV